VFFLLNPCELIKMRLLLGWGLSKSFSKCFIRGMLGEQDQHTSAHILAVMIDTFWCLISTEAGMSFESTTCLRKRMKALRGRGMCSGPCYGRSTRSHPSSPLSNDIGKWRAGTKVEILMFDQPCAHGSTSLVNSQPSASPSSAV
jgi:hypothetical protein